MNTAQAYAHILSGMHTAAEAGTVIRYMKKKGHLPLLPHIVRMLARFPEEDTAVLMVAHEKDTKTFREKSVRIGGDPKRMRVIIDRKIVGGYLARKQGLLVEATYRRFLVDLYKKAVNRLHG